MAYPSRVPTITPSLVDSQLEGHRAARWFQYAESTTKSEVQVSVLMSTTDGQGRVDLDHKSSGGPLPL